jgi:FAD/FMN-containing dehydrogenase
MTAPRGIETDAILSWGRTVRAPQLAFAPSWRDELPATLQAAASARPGKGVLPIGLSRSYGDSNLNPDGAVVLTAALDRIIAFDAATRLLRAEAGTSLAALLEWLVPLGFFLPVTPGTRHVTLGGAVANDVHGKNHHGAGTFGRWVRAIGLLRSDGTELVLRPGDDLFDATIGGLGLTGLIAWVEIELMPLGSSLVETEDTIFEDLDGFFRLAEASDSWEYTVAWVDCMAKGSALGRGIFSRGRHAPAGERRVHAPPRLLRVPFDAPGFALNRFSVGAFNALYLALGRRRAGRLRRVPYLPFFYPLDGIAGWNRLYGRSGFFQYQCVVPPEAAPGAMREMLQAIAAAGQGSFLAVLKTFGALRSPGLLSFPMPGTTLALDFPNRGAATLGLLARLDDITRAARGRLYPAKDGRIPPDLFRAGYPDWERLARHMDPHFSSAFWRRVSAA